MAGDNSEFENAQYLVDTADIWQFLICMFEMQCALFQQHVAPLWALGVLGGEIEANRGDTVMFIRQGRGNS